MGGGAGAPGGSDVPEPAQPMTGTPNPIDPFEKEPVASYCICEETFATKGADPVQLFVPVTFQGIRPRGWGTKAIRPESWDEMFRTPWGSVTPAPNDSRERWSALVPYSEAFRIPNAPTPLPVRRTVAPDVRFSNSTWYIVNDSLA